MGKMEDLYSDSSVSFLKKLPSKKKLSEMLGFTPEKVLIIYDRKVSRQEPIQSWMEDFSLKYGVSAGEKLKELEEFPDHVKKIMKLLGTVSPRNCCVIALGGGTVGDFAGFFASVFKRGVPLIHVPTTLLAAMDSAHGGKTALNVGDLKNQIGSFYPAHAVLIVREIFENLPPLQLHSAAGELAKMALIEGGKFFEDVQSTHMKGFEEIWQHLPEAISAKYKVVEQDPLEQSGERAILNLGHTLGHALELYYDLPHGVAVGLGLVFSVNWSHHHGYLNFQDLERISDLLHDKFGIQRAHQFLAKRKQMSRSRLRRFIAEDKKVTDNEHLSFIFLSGIGKTLRRTVTLDSVLTEAQRQGWVSG
jgi:3-dehydroquinate synthase